MSEARNLNTNRGNARAKKKFRQSGNFFSSTAFWVATKVYGDMNGKKSDRNLNHYANLSGDGRNTVEDAISRQLLSYYASVANEPIPDRFIELLEKLDEAEKQARSPRRDNDDEA